LLLSTPARAHEPAQDPAVQAEQVVKQISNPVADPLGVPFQFDRDNGVGTNDDFRSARNGRPDAPFSCPEAGTGLATVRPIDD
jgi:hypothetical protein